MTSLRKFTSLHIDYKSNSSYLCELGKKYDTDKSSQRSNVTNSRHCHPYTLFYNSLFKNKCDTILDIAEIGILDGSSLRMWQEYFPRANVYGFEYDDLYINKFKESFNNDRVTLAKIDVTNVDSIKSSFQSTHKLYDVIIDDSTHQFEDQIRVIENTYQYVKPGGALIIEDIFKRYNENDYIARLLPILGNFQDYYFISLDHVNRNSTGWDNDKLFILIKNGAEPIFKNTNKITIITPSHRIMNLPKIKDSINFDYVDEWIIVYDENKIHANPKLFLGNPKINEYLHKSECISGNPQRNYALAQIKNKNTILYYLDDDNTIHPQLYKLLNIIEADKIYTFNQTSRLKGDTPKLNKIDTAMVLIDNNLCENLSWNKHQYGADGIYIETIYNKNKDKHIFVDDDLCYYNKLEDQYKSKSTTPSVRPPVLSGYPLSAQPVVEFLMAKESPERTLPVHIGNETITQSAILYNVEQMTCVDGLTKLLQTASNPFVKEVWDYSTENCKILAANGIVARHVPLISPATYVQQIKDLRKDVIYDVGFCGAVCWNIVCRRQVILNKMRDAGLSVHFVNKHGLERDTELAKCRVILNIHFAEDYKIFEQVRCDVWLRAGIPVVSETSLDDDPRCINVPYGSIVETTVSLLKDLRPRQPANDSVVIGMVHTKGCTTTMKALTQLLNQTLDKSKVHVVLASSKDVNEFITFDLLNRREYASVSRYIGDHSYEHVIGKALELGSHVCFMESRHLLESYTIQTLLDSKEKGVIAPMLVSNTRYSNYHTKVDINGYIMDEPMYDDLLYKRVKGQIAVPVVNGMYFIHHKLLPQISYTDGTNRDSYVILCDGLRKKGIPQYLDNRRTYGTIM